MHQKSCKNWSAVCYGNNSFFAIVPRAWMRKSSTLVWLKSTASTWKTAESTFTCLPCTWNNSCLPRWQQRTLTIGEVSLYIWPPVYFLWIQLLCLCWMNNCFTCLTKFKPVKQEVSRKMILPLWWCSLVTDWLWCCPICVIMNYLGCKNPIMAPITNWILEF